MKNRVAPKCGSRTGATFLNHLVVFSLVDKELLHSPTCIGICFIPSNPVCQESAKRNGPQLNERKYSLMEPI